MGRHAKSFNVITDALAVVVTLLLAYLRVVRNVSAGRHAWKPLPEIDTGATVQFAAVLHGWNADPKTVRFEALLWPPTSGDLSDDAHAEIAEVVEFERTQDAATWYTEVDA